jgi:hypothetical protein
MKNENWIEEQLEKLESKTNNYTKQEKTKIGYHYLKNGLNIVATKINDNKELDEFKTKIEMIIESIPIKDNGVDINYGTFLSNLSNFKKTIKKKYNIVSKGTYISQGVGLGMPFGVLLGLLLGNIALGLPIGLMIGLIIGSALESKAKKENRILN